MQPPAPADASAPPPPDAFPETTSFAPTWEPTRTFSPSTELLSDPDDYLGLASRRDIGRPMGDNLRELFVSCDPAPAMLQQFELLHPEYVAVHDIGTASSRRLLGAVATASQRSMQRLVIRRQGYGTPLATLDFVEFDDAAGGAPLRLYSTESDADTASRHNLARVLLAHSRLAVIMVGDLPSHALSQALQPLQSDIAAGQWKNGHLLLLPLASPAAIASLGSQLGRGGGRRDSTRGGSVTVRTTPQITHPAEAWNFISATWNRLREQLAVQGVMLPGLPNANGAPPVVLPPLAAASGVPSVGQAASAAGFAKFTPSLAPSFDETSLAELAPGGDALHNYVSHLTQINGVVAACVFSAAGGKPVAHAGSSFRANALAHQGLGILAALQAAEKGLEAAAAHDRGAGMRAGDVKPAGLLPEAAITLARHHLLVRPLPSRPGLVLHAVLDKSSANLTLARLQIARLDPTLVEAHAGHAPRA